MLNELDFLKDGSRAGVRVARVVGSPEQGRVLVEIDGGEPVAARLASGALEGDGEAAGSEVLVVFENGDPARPVVLARLVPTDRPPEPAEKTEEMGVDAVVDGRAVAITAKEAVLIRCGKASIQLRRDGRITVRGTHILSRASGPNRIKGGHVDIN